MAGVRGEIPLEEAEAIAAMMVQTGRAVPAWKWVDVLIDKAERMRMERVY